MPETGSSWPESERRVATILFADISGFTAMSERLEAETVTDLVNACFAAIGRVAEGRGGFVDKYIGDCAMILFGAPRTVESAPDKALRAALDIRDAIARVDAELKPPVALRVHCGINTGTVVAGYVGSAGAMSYTVMGDAVNVASRLKDAAEPGQVLVGAETRSGLREGYVFGAKRIVAAKGKEGGIEAWELVSSTVPGKVGAAASRSARAKLVGRDPELRSLERLAIRVRAGEGSVVVLSGEAGIGKTRLVEEFLGSDAAAACQALVGRCRADGSKLSYHPFIEAIKGWVEGKPVVGLDRGLQGSEGSDLSARLARSIAEAAPAEAGEIYPFIAGLLGASLPEAEERRIAEMKPEGVELLACNAVRVLLSRLAESRPLVFVVEDLHFADASSLELLGSCLRLAGARPILFLATSRPGFDGSAEWLRKIREGAQETRCQEMDLAALEPASSRILVDGLAGASALDPYLRRKIAERSGGNPRFIEELVRSLPGGAELPSSIGEVIMGRIDRLDPAARDILKAASAAGLSVGFRILREALSPVDGLEEGLGRLVEAGFLAEERPDGELGFRFVSEIARDVAYSSLVSGRRKELHRRLAEAMERIRADRLEDHAGLLALHYSRAERFEKAQAYMLLAGRSALKAAATNEAISHFRDALELCLLRGRDRADPALTDSIERDIARSLFAKGRYQEAVPYYYRILSRRGYPEEGSPAALARAALGWAHVMAWVLFPRPIIGRPLPPDLLEDSDFVWELSSMLQSFGKIRSMGVLFGIGADSSRRFDLKTLLPGVIVSSFYFVHSRRTRWIGKRILEITAPLLGDDQKQARLIHVNMTLLLNQASGDYSLRAKFRDPIIRFQADRIGLYNSLHALYCCSMLCLEVGDWANFAEARRRLAETTERFDADVGRGCLDNLAMQYLIKCRKLAEAEEAVPRIVDSLARTGYQAFRSRDFAARVALMKGDIGTAAAEFARADEAWAGQGKSAMGNSYHFGAAAALAVAKARAAAAEGRRAGPVFRQGRAMVRRYLAGARDRKPDLPEALRLQGSLAWHAGKPTRALASWKRAIAAAERSGARLELAHTYCDAGELLGDQAPGPEWRARGAALRSESGLS